MVLKSKINQSFTLSNDSLGHLNQDILKPKYDRALLSPGIIHIGVGNFHRAHQAVYLDEYLNNNKDLRWGIIGFNLRQSESDNLNSLKERGGKYVLKTISTTGVIKFNEIHSIIGLYDWSKNQKEAELILNNPDIEILTMTITETGYYISGTGELNTKLDIVKNNIEGKEKTTIYSYLHNALKIRKEKCNKPITLLCCDNIRENGVMLKQTLYKYIKACNDINLLDWIDSNVSFPSCVVDRITPRVPDNLAKEINNQFNIDEQCSIMGESFIQWVVEDDFIGKAALEAEVGRGPEWDFVGIEIQWHELEKHFRKAGLAPGLPSTAWRTSTPLYKGSEQVGYATSGAWSPILKRYIALAHVKSEYAGEGSELMFELKVEHYRKLTPAKVVKTPFFDPERKRSCPL